jgi:hypothetical protein
MTKDSDEAGKPVLAQAWATSGGMGGFDACVTPVIKTLHKTNASRNT